MGNWMAPLLIGRGYNFMGTAAPRSAYAANLFRTLSNITD